MVIVTVMSSTGEPERCLVGLHTRCSIRPARYLVCLSTVNRTHDAAAGADTMVVHHPATFDADLARLFGEETGDEVDKFADVAWTASPGGAPVLTDVASWWEGRVVDRIDLGDHTGFVLAPTAGHAGTTAPEFTSDDAAALDPGHPRG
jgi:flavin reductase (DIM6/NTAB) family NADH-FMN oxidoreductase RutF